MTFRLDIMRAGIYGVLVGDALGVPYEFQRPEQIGEVVWGAPTDRAKPGTWNDDGSLTLALLDSLTSVGCDTADQACRFLACVDTSAYTPHGEGRFDGWTRTPAALLSCQSWGQRSCATPNYRPLTGGGTRTRSPDGHWG